MGTMGTSRPYQQAGGSICELLTHMRDFGAEHLHLTAFGADGKAVHHIAITAGEKADDMAVQSREFLKALAEQKARDAAAAALQGAATNVS